MTAPLEKAVEESRKWLSWYGAGMFGEGVDDPGAGGPAELLTALLAALDADKSAARARETEDGAVPLETPECNDGDDCCRYCGRGLQPCGACKPPAPPADAATEAVREAFAALLSEPGDLDYPVEDVYSDGPDVDGNGDAPFWSEGGLYGRVGKEAARTLLARHRRATEALSALSTPAPAPSAKEKRS